MKLLRDEKNIRDVESNDLQLELIGRRIVSTSGETLTLDNGTVLEFEDTADCCAYFNANVEVFDFEDNVITNVRDIDTSTGEYREAWSLHVLSKHKLIAKVNIEGNSGSGYYCHSVDLTVRKGVSNV